MDKRLKLTAKQKELVKEMEKAFAKEEIGIVFDMTFGEFRLFNAAECLGYDYSDEYRQDDEEYVEEPYGDFDEETEEGHMWYSPKEDDLEILQISVTLADYESWFAVQLKENEDSNAFFRKKKIVKLQDDLKKEKKNLKRHQDAITQAESNIEIFKKKGLAQDLIDEENASILSNQESVQKYQKVIEKLESEIEKLKET